MCKCSRRKVLPKLNQTIAKRTRQLARLDAKLKIANETVTQKANKPIVNEREKWLKNRVELLKEEIERKPLKG